MEKVPFTRAIANHPEMQGRDTVSLNVDGYTGQSGTLVDLLPNIAHDRTMVRCEGINPNHAPTGNPLPENSTIATPVPEDCSGKWLPPFAKHQQQVCRRVDAKELDSGNREPVYDYIPMKPRYSQACRGICDLSTSTIISTSIASNGSSSTISKLRGGFGLSISIPIMQADSHTRTGGASGPHHCGICLLGKTIDHDLSQSRRRLVAHSCPVASVFPFKHPVRLLGITLSSLSTEDSGREPQLVLGL